LIKLFQSKRGGWLWRQSAVAAGTSATEITMQ